MSMDRESQIATERYALFRLLRSDAPFEKCQAVWRKIEALSAPSSPVVGREGMVQCDALTRDALIVDPRLTIFAQNAAKSIARVERLDNVSAKEAYRTIIDAMASACLAMEAKAHADRILAHPSADRNTP